MKSARKYASKIINERYINARISYRDLFPYGELLMKISNGFESITEVILSPINNQLTFTWCMLESMNKSRSHFKSIYGTDPKRKFVHISKDKFHSEMSYTKDLSIYSDIEFHMMRLKAVKEIQSTDMMFIYIDSRSSDNSKNTSTHTEIFDVLNRFQSFVKKNIVIHDRGLNYEIMDYSDKFNLSKGVQSASIEFLQKNHQWSLVTGNNTEFGFTILSKDGDK
jgi:hypothetical protein